MLSWLRGFVRSQASRIRKRKGQELDEDHQQERNPRYEPCDILVSRKIPCKVWCEDVLAWYGVPTVLFDLFILVHEPKEALDILIDSGYIQTQPNRRFARTSQLSYRVTRLIRPPDSSSLVESFSKPPEADIDIEGVVLLSTKEWDYDLPQSIDDLECLIPDIHEYFDHIVSKWMDLGSDDSDLSDYLGVHIAYHTAYIDEVWKSEFAERIRKEHRQLLFDLLATCSGMEAGPSDLLLEECRTYHRQIRDKILQGTFEPPGTEKFKWQRPDTKEVGTRVTFTVTETGIKLIDDSTDLKGCAKPR
ncbi:hypothetical protein FQN50_000022 [Emmonsiellopsis sp. PD_5]|nr:hypothetical protein FQN50_000022 [Emmonsiellopsis sp. PD_5]